MYWNRDGHWSEKRFWKDGIIFLSWYYLISFWLTNFIHQHKIISTILLGGIKIIKTLWKELIKSRLSAGNNFFYETNGNIC